MIFELLFFFAWILLSIPVHELGHYVAARDLGYKAKFSLFRVDVFGMNDEFDYDSVVIAVAGVVSGGLFLSAGFWFFDTFLWSLVFIWYFWGCRFDFKYLKDAYLSV